MTKTGLRKTIKTRFAALDPEEYTAAGQKAAEKLSSLPGWENFLSVLIFMSLKDEINTLPVIEAALSAGKRIFAPKVDGDTMTFYRIDLQIPGRKRGNAKARKDGGAAFSESLAAGAFGILEPAAGTGAALAPEDFPALVITPGRAFDRQGRRLGRGRGYYDRFFASLDAGGLNGAPAALPYTAVGLCMDCQLVDEVPAEPHDKTMHGVLTEQGLYLRPA